MIQIIVPALGESITEAIVAKWFKGVGDTIIADEPLVELETDKVTVEVPAPSTGVLKEILAPNGSTVLVGATLGTLDVDASASIHTPVSVSAPQPSSPVVPLPQSVPVMPSAQKMMQESRINPEAVTGTGKGGRITKEDIKNYREHISTPAVSSTQNTPAITSENVNEERVRMTRLRKRVAERLKDAQNTAAMLTTFNEVDMSALNDIRNCYKESFEKKHGIKLGFMSFFVKAAVGALKEWPAVNAEIDGDDIVYKNHYDIGVAVGTPSGLVVPVVRDADRLSFAGIESTIAALGKKARDGKLTINELMGGTFTISNGGIYGSLMSTPILNPPQSGILGMHKIQQRPVAMPDGSIQVRPMMYLALSYDHRIIDGREAVSFLIALKNAIEDPRRLLLEL